MKTKKQIEQRLKEKKKQLNESNYKSYSERRCLHNWTLVLKWVLK